LQSKLKRQLQIDAMARRGQDEYDELSKKYRDEQERQISALEQQIEQRNQRRQELEE